MVAEICLTCNGTGKVAGRLFGFLTTTCISCKGRGTIGGPLPNEIAKSSDAMLVTVADLAAVQSGGLRSVRNAQPIRYYQQCSEE